MEQESFGVLAKGDSIDDEDFEDISKDLFTCIDTELSELDLLMNEKNFNWEDVMTSFETMDKKMDQRVSKNTILVNNKEIMSELNSLSETPLTLSKKLALIRELLLQFATWQQKVTHLQQSIFSNLILTRKSYYLSCPDMMPVVEAILYMIHVFYLQVRCT